MKRQNLDILIFETGSPMCLQLTWNSQSPCLSPLSAKITNVLCIISCGFWIFEIKVLDSQNTSLGIKFEDGFSNNIGYCVPAPTLPGSEGQLLGTQSQRPTQWPSLSGLNSCGRSWQMLTLLALSPLSVVKCFPSWSGQLSLSRCTQLYQSSWRRLLISVTWRL